MAFPNYVKALLLIAVTQGAAIAMPIPSSRAQSPAPAKVPGANEIRDLYRQIEARAPRNFPGVDAAQRSAIYRLASTNPVAALSAIKKYDPSGIIGFCFGRALTVALVARQMGLDPNGIRKLFIVGDLRSSEAPEWRFHVTTLVRGNETTEDPTNPGNWYAIDPILPEPMRASEWIRVVRSVWDRSHRARLYLTAPNVVMPDLRSNLPIEQEGGNRVIELSFRPERRAGFLARPNGLPGDEAFLVARGASDAYFMTPGSLPPAVDFDFTHVQINGDAISYNGYFADLMATLARAPRAVFAVAASDRARVAENARSASRSALTAPAAIRPFSLNLGSPRLDAIRAQHARTHR